MSKQKYQKYEPERCWVGDTHKICYATRDEAEVAAAVVQYDHGGDKLSVYRCEFGEHWHLSSERRSGEK